jgi:WD40 repeat protein
MPGTPHDAIQGVSFSGDGRTLIAARATGTIRFWDIADRRRIITLRVDSELDCVAFTSDGRFMAAGGADATVRVWDLAPSLTQGLVARGGVWGRQRFRSQPAMRKHVRSWSVGLVCSGTAAP